VGRTKDTTLSAFDVTIDLLTHRAERAGQPELIGQVFDNFLDNAFKYSTPGTTVAVRVRGDDSHVVIEVEDHGVGIGHDDQSHVFEPFFRSADARQRGIAGVGLGLAVGKRIAAAVGAVIFMRSVPGKGSTFGLRLPRFEASAGQYEEFLIRTS
jgi:signal transduction histidine kinase